MPLIEVKASQLAREQVLPTGWYKATLKSFEEVFNNAYKESKGTDPKSGTNYEIVFTIEDTDGFERDSTVWFPTKQLGSKFLKFYYAVALGKKFTIDDFDNLKKTGIQVDTNDLDIGTELQVFVNTEIYKNRPLNKIDDFLPVGESVESPF